MINKPTAYPNIRQFQLVLFGILIACLIPLVSIPRPSMLTGHPWKAEFAISGLVLASLLWLSAKCKPESVRSLFAARPISLAVGSIMLFALWSAISVLWADATVSVVHHTTVWFLYGSIFFLALLFLKETRSISGPIAALATLSLVITAISLFDCFSAAQFRFVESVHLIRYSKYGEMVAMIAPLLFSAPFISRKQSAKIIWIITGNLAWLFVMFTLSKGAFLAGAVGIIFVFVGVLFLGGRKRRNTVFVTSLIWILMTVTLQLAFAFSTSIPSTAQDIAGASKNQRVSIPFRIFTWKVGASMALSNPILGVGADNFGTSFNEARRVYFANNPSAATEGRSIAEDYMFERAHNEPLQIFAELGLVGALLFGLIILAFCMPLFAHIRDRKRLSPVLIGSTAGIVAFAFSSMFSSFSFRAIQNGAVFFLILAIAFYELTKRGYKTEGLSDVRHWPNSIARAKWLLPALALICFVFHALIGISNFYLLFGQIERDRVLSRSHFETAVKINPENGAAYHVAGVREFFNERPDEAIRLLERSRKYGTGATLNYFYTASSYLLKNDGAGAVAVMSEAVDTFPRSVYARVHYSVLLEETGNREEAKRQYSEARLIDKRQAETWRLVLKDGLLDATNATRNRTDLDKPNELAPQNIIEAIFDISRLNKTDE